MYQETIVPDDNGDPLEWKNIEEIEAGDSYAHLFF